MSMTWFALDPRCTQEHLGFIPLFLEEADPRPAKEQFDDRYSHGGGWFPFKDFTLDDEWTLSFAGDPPMKPLAFTRLRKETIILYPHAWVVIRQDDGSWEAARMD